MGCLIMLGIMLGILLSAVFINTVVAYFCWNYAISYLALTMFNTTLPAVNWTQAFVIGVLLYLVEAMLSSKHTND